MARRVRGDLALDLKTGWDCTGKEDRMWAYKEIERRKPRVVGLSPPCTLFSALQNLPKDKRDEREFQTKYRETW